MQVTSLFAKPQRENLGAISSTSTCLIGTSTSTRLGPAQAHSAQAQAQLELNSKKVEHE